MIRLATLLLFCFLETHLLTAATKALPGAHLQASIKIIAPGDDPAKVQPGSSVKLSAIVKNIGDKVNQAGTIYIRFSFLKPLDGEPRSVLFETEKKALPSIPPGGEKEIEFTKVHQWPSVFDYIRDDWHMRQYEAVIDIKGKTQVIGRAAVSVSAKYYHGPSHEIPAEVQSGIDNNQINSL